MAKKLRFGLMMDDLYLEAWQVSTIKRLLDSGHAELVLVIRKPAPEARNPTLWAKLSLLGQRRVRLTLLWQLYNRLFAYRSTSIKRIDCADLLAGVDCLFCETIVRGNYSEFFAPGDVASVKAYRLDFLLRFGFAIIRGEILEAAKFGVWSYHHGDERKLRGGPPCFWEIVFGHQTTGALLQRLTDELDCGVVLHRGVFKTHWDYFRNLDQVQWKSAEWCARVCKEISFGNHSIASKRDDMTVGPIMRAPSNRAFILYVYRWTLGLIKAVVGTFFQYDMWNVGLVHRTIAQIKSDGQISGVQWLPSAGHYRYLADPFALRNGDGIAMFVEDFDYRRSYRGRIGRCDVSATGVDAGAAHSLKIEDVIEAEHHLSYPFLFSVSGEVYCIPESFEARRCDLYRIIGGQQAVFEATLLEGIAFVDPTVFRYDDRWWLFFTDFDRGSELDLFAYYADELRGDWRPHHLNPLKCDVSSSRPAGSPFLSDGVWYRPAQDCSVTYGGAVVLNRLIELSPTRFREEVVGRIAPEAPGRYPDGFHTITQIGDVCVVDGKKIVTDPTWLFRRRRYEQACAARRKRLKNNVPSHSSRSAPQADETPNICA